MKKRKLKYKACIIYLMSVFLKKKKDMKIILKINDVRISNNTRV